MIYDGGCVPLAPPICNVDVARSHRHSEGGRPKGIYFASSLTQVIINIERRGVAGGTAVRRWDDQTRWVGGIVRGLQLAKFLPSSVWWVFEIIRGGQ